MDSTTPDRDDDMLERTDEIRRVVAQHRSPRIATGTIAPPVDEEDWFEAEDGDLDALRTLATEQRDAEAWHELADTLHRIVDAGPIGEDQTIELYAQLASSKATCSAASTTRSTPGAR